MKIALISAKLTNNILIFAFFRLVAATVVLNFMLLILLDCFLFSIRIFFIIYIHSLVAYFQLYLSYPICLHAL